jgi:hypothetical protein
MYSSTRNVDVKLRTVRATRPRVVGDLQGNSSIQRTESVSSLITLQGPRPATEFSNALRSFSLTVPVFHPWLIDRLKF